MNDEVVIDGTYDLPMTFDSKVVGFARNAGFFLKGGHVDHRVVNKAAAGHTYEDMYGVNVVDAIRDIADEAIAWLNDNRKDGKKWMIKDSKLIHINSDVNHTF